MRASSGPDSADLKCSAIDSWIFLRTGRWRWSRSAVPVNASGRRLCGTPRAARRIGRQALALVLLAAPEQALDADSVRTSSTGDAALAERLDEGDAVAQVVVGHQVVVGGDQGAEVLAEGDVDRRAVVEGADAHVEDVRGRPWRPRRPGGSTRSGWRSPSRQHAGAAGGDPQQVGDARLVDGQEGVEDGGHQDGAAGVRLVVVGSRAGSGSARLPLAGLRVDPRRWRRAGRRACRSPGRTAGRARRAGSALREVAAGRGDLVRAATSGRVKCWNRATMSANASWKARTSGLRRLDEAAVQRRRAGRGSSRGRRCRATGR